MRIDEAVIQSYCKNKPGIVFTIGTHENGVDAIDTFGNNGASIAPETRAYEIGSISKVFLSTFLVKCVESGTVSLSDAIDQYVDLPPGNTYPSFLQLATHTSGYTDPALFDSAPKALSWSFSSTKKQHNPFDDFGSRWLIDAIIEASRKPRKKEGCIRYSNFGFSVLGYALGKATGGTYHDYIASYIENLGFSSTVCGSEKLPMVHGFKKGKDCGNWRWSEDSAYAPAGCLCSNAVELLSFAKMNLYDEKSYLTSSHQERVSGKTGNIGSIGLGWMLEKDDDVVWHNGGTGFFYSFLAFSKSRGRAVVFLSNCISSLGIAEDKLVLSILKSMKRP